MSNNDKKTINVMIVEDEEDILSLYTDYLSHRGHNVVCSSLNADNVLANFEKSKPDICLIDYVVQGKAKGLDAAAKILQKSPSTPILFTTAFESINKELPKHPEFTDKHIRVLVKPTRLLEIENSILDMVN